MARHLLTAVLAVAVAAVVRAEAPREPLLIPVSVSLEEFGDYAQYRLVVRDHLLGQRLSSQSVVVFPSFQKEWALQLAYDRGEPFVIYSVPDLQVWGSLQQRVEQSQLSEAEILRQLRVSVDRQSAPLSHEVARAVESAWGRMVMEARRPPEPRRIIDGTTYLFFHVDASGVAKAGLSRSPAEGTPAAMLVHLVDALRAHATSPAEGRKRSEQAILSLSKDVLTSMRQSSR
jgi:hypothetical protein